MFVGKLNLYVGVGIVSFDRLDLFEGLYAFPPKRIPESAPGSAPVGSGCNARGKTLDRLVLDIDVFREIAEGHDGRG